MADKKISDLTLLSTADATDMLPVVDVSANLTKRTSVAGLAAAVAANIPDGSLPYAKGDGKNWWEEIGRTTLSPSPGDSIIVSNLPLRKNLRILVQLKNVGALDVGLRFNGDTGVAYNYRQSINGAADTTVPSATFIRVEAGSYNVTGIYEVTNVATYEKQVLGRITGANAPGVTNIPSRIELSGKWTNTAAAISSVTIYNVGTGDFAVGSEVIVLGHD